jgi:hypothetical protein
MLHGSWCVQAETQQVMKSMGKVYDDCRALRSTLVVVVRSPYCTTVECCVLRRREVSSNRDSRRVCVDDRRAILGTLTRMQRAICHLNRIECIRVNALPRQHTREV